MSEKYVHPVICGNYVSDTGITKKEHTITLFLSSILASGEYTNATEAMATATNLYYEMRANLHRI